MFLKLHNKINIALCGMMGAGKSIIGKNLAKKIKYTFIDIDELIEKKVEKSIMDIFNDYGGM